MTHKHISEPYESSIHRWSPATGAIETWLLASGSDVLGWAKGGPGWWYVTVEWQLVDGVPMPTAFEVEATRGKKHDRLKPISRELTKRLPLGEIITQGLEQLIAFHEGVTLALDADTPERRMTSDVLRTATPGGMDDVYRLAYSLHSNAKASGHRQPSVWTWQKLVANGVTTRSGESPSHDNVRTKWIPKGKALAAKDARRTQSSGQVADNREEQK